MPVAKRTRRTAKVAGTTTPAEAGAEDKFRDEPGRSAALTHYEGGASTHRPLASLRQPSHREESRGATSVSGGNRSSMNGLEPSVQRAAHP
jgi:hypothetical protein